MTMELSGIDPRREGEQLMQKFREEIQEAKDTYARTKVTGHLANVEVTELTDEDRQIWERVKGGRLSREDFFEYEKKIYDDAGNSLVGESRARFADFVGNKMVYLKKAA